MINDRHKKALHPGNLETDTCPDCGTALENACGCSMCRTCGYSPCG